MQRVKTISLLASTLLLFACSTNSKGGTGSPSDYENTAVGGGNIPLAEPGGELADVNFAYDSSALDEFSKAILRENVKWLVDNPQEKVEIQGHCDERGTNEYNLALGLRRAQSVKEFLITSGVKSTPLDVKSYGEELPLDPSSNEDAWGKNRRVHFDLTP